MAATNPQPATPRFDTIDALRGLSIFLVILLHARLRLSFAHAPFKGALLAALTFTLTWWKGMRGYLPANWDVLWSLSVEEMFYLFFPVACLWVTAMLLAAAPLGWILARFWAIPLNRRLRPA